MSVEAKVDTSKCIAAFRLYAKATKHTGAETLNKFLKDVAYRSAQFTPFVSAAAIKKDLKKDPHLRYALTSLLLARLSGKKLTANQIKYNTLNRLSRTKGLLGKGQFQKAVDAFVARRGASSKYLRAAFAEAVGRLGGTFRGAKFKGAKGFANKATISHLVAEIVGIVSEPDEKHARGAEAEILPAVQKAIDDKIVDMTNYANSELAKLGREVSGRK